MKEVAREIGKVILVCFVWGVLMYMAYTLQSGWAYLGSICGGIVGSWSIFEHYESLAKIGEDKK